MAAATQPRNPADPDDEMLEIVDARDRVIGLERRARCHGDPQLTHRAVHVFVKSSKGAFFLQKRSRLKRIQPGRWDTSVGGHLAPGESYEAAARRELHEELGIRLPPEVRLRRLHDYVWRSEVETEHIRTFLLEHDGPFELHPEEIEDGRFWTVSELQAAAGTGALTPSLEDELRRLAVFG